jgi:hypothetical protein
MSAFSDAKSSPRDARSLRSVRRLVVVLTLSVLPAVAASAFPPSVLEEKNLSFLTLYVVTLPWSLALSAIVAGFAGGWFGPSERKQVFAATGILALSALIGAAIAPGSPSGDHFQGGAPWVVVAEAIVFGVIGYALMYGWPMWFASFVVAAYVGWWVRDRRERADALEPAIRTGLRPRFEPPTPNVRVRREVALETPPLAPPPKSDVPIEEVVEAEPPPRRLDEELLALTKAELYRRAREAGIKGRSAMSKDQLAAALRVQGE